MNIWVCCFRFLLKTTIYLIINFVIIYFLYQPRPIVCSLSTASYFLFFISLVILSSLYQPRHIIFCLSASSYYLFFINLATLSIVYQPRHILFSFIQFWITTSSICLSSFSLLCCKRFSFPRVTDNAVCWLCSTPRNCFFSLHISFYSILHSDMIIFFWLLD